MIMAERFHYSDVIVSTMASQTTGVSIVYWTVCSGIDQRKRHSSAPLAFVPIIAVKIHLLPTSKKGSFDTNISINALEEEVYIVARNFEYVNTSG